jgi:GntR family transcriptional regulator/MocR family aminotransferase
MVALASFDGLGWSTEDSPAEKLARDVASSLGSVAPGEKVSAMEKALRLAIAAGDLPGRRLPSIANLAVALGVTPKRVGTAYKALLAEGRIIERVDGWFVTDSAWVEPPEYAIGSRKLQPLAPGSTASDLFPAQAWLRYLDRAAADYGGASFRPGPVGGMPDARRALADLLRTRLGLDVTAADVAIITSRARALESALAVTSGIGNEIWIEDPAPGMHRAVIGRLHRSVVAVPVDARGLRVDEGVQMAPVASAAIVSGASQFPLGHLTSAARREQLSQWAVENNSFVIEDWRGCEAGLSGPHHDSAAPWPNTIRIGSLESLCFEGIGLGWITAPRPIMRAILAELSTIEESPTMSVQSAFAAYVSSGLVNEHVVRLAGARKERLEALELGLLGTLPSDAEVRVDLRGLHCAIKLPSSIDCAALVGDAAARGLGVRALSDFYADPNQAANGVLIGWCGTPARRTYAAATELAQLIASAPSVAAKSQDLPIPAPRLLHIV